MQNKKEKDRNKLTECDTYRERAERHKHRDKQGGRNIPTRRHTVRCTQSDTHKDSNIQRHAERQTHTLGREREARKEKEMHKQKTQA
jgi:hypothetical protein